MPRLRAGREVGPTERPCETDGCVNIVPIERRVGPPRRFCDECFLRKKRADNAKTAKGRWEKMRARIAELEAGLRACIEWAASDCEHPACKGVIETATRLVQITD